MEFFNRVRKIRTPSQVQNNEHANSNITNIIDKEDNLTVGGLNSLLNESNTSTLKQYNNYHKVIDMNPSPIMVGINNKKISSDDQGIAYCGSNLQNNISKCRKVYKLNTINKSHSTSTNSHDSSSRHNSHEINIRHLSPLSNALNAMARPKSSCAVKKQVSPQSSTGNDSGIDSGKNKVCQQDSNMSTGSVMSGHDELVLKLGNRCQNLIKTSHYNKEDKNNIRDRTKNHQKYKKEPLRSDHLQDLYSSLEKINYKDKRKKKQKDIASTLDLSKIPNDNNCSTQWYNKKRNTNKSCPSLNQPNNCKSVDSCSDSCESDSDRSSDEDSYIEEIISPTETENLKSVEQIKKRGRDRLVNEDDFADDENDEYLSTGSQINREVNAPIASEDGITSSNSEDNVIKIKKSDDLNNKTEETSTDFDDFNDSGHKSGSTPSSEKDLLSASSKSSEHGHNSIPNKQTVGGNSTSQASNNSHKAIKQQPQIVKRPSGSNHVDSNNNKIHNKIETVKKSQADERQLVPSNNTRLLQGHTTAKHYPNNAVAHYHPNAGNHHYSKPAHITTNNPHVKNENYAFATKFSTNLPKVPILNKVQPTSKRVNGVTLRDLYSLRAVLSDSDNGTVFSGRRRIDNAAVAIKRIMKGKVKRWHMIKEKSVPMEIALLRKVNETRHAGVVTLLEWFECSDCFLLVMARPTPVLDLFDYVSEKKRLDESTSKMIFIQVVEAMYHCHLRSVLHRDIKLENVLVKTDSLISTIIDFGCGTHLHSNLYKDFAGTPQYYPPEYYICKQYHGLPAAVWSVGVMLYAMLCGRLPFASAHEIVHLEPSWHGSFCRKISPAAKDLVEHMLKKQPRRRLQMAEVLKHRWLKNAKYDSATGEVTIITESSIISSNGTQILSEILETSAGVANNNVNKKPNAPSSPFPVFS